MAFIVKTAKTLRNHWKKSTFAAIVISYGFTSAKEYFETQELMRVYCQKAAKYGHEPIPLGTNPRNITVILNPNANKRKAAEEFDKYCAPLLHLAGILVDVVRTTSEGHAKELMTDLKNTDAIVVAGGDGTLSEVLTGLLRRTEENTNGLVPIGVLPLGKVNSVAKSFFPGGHKLEKIKSLGDATMAVVEEVTKPVDVIRVQILDENNAEPKKPVYAVGSIKWGAYRDAESKKDSYWYYGGLRKYATYLFNGYKSSLTWNCEAQVNYTAPCEGCQNCVNISKNIQSHKWYDKFIKKDNPQAKYLSIKNPECEEIREKNVETTDFELFTSNLIPSENSSKLKIKIGPDSVDYIDFVRQGWQSENGQDRDVKEVIEARTVEIKPKIVSSENKEIFFSIDNENFEVAPVKITLLPKLVNMFCKKESL